MVGVSGKLYTIGHSNHELGTFLGLLRDAEIEVLVDVRSNPVSRYARHFNKTEFQDSLARAGITYLYLGRELGGKPKPAEFYDATGRVLYPRLAQSPLFREGIERLHSEVVNHRVAVMCSEEDPTGCHRRMLIAPSLAARGVAVLHLRGDGRVQTAEQLVQDRIGTGSGGVQLAMLDSSEEVHSRSAKPIR
jgi:uncharacterized protein (DUF488 family)